MCPECSVFYASDRNMESQSACLSVSSAFGHSANRLLHLVVLQTETSDTFDWQLAVWSWAKISIPMVVLTSDSVVIIECSLTHNHFANDGIDFGHTDSDFPAWLGSKAMAPGLEYQVNFWAEPSRPN